MRDRSAAATRSVKQRAYFRRGVIVQRHSLDDPHHSAIHDKCHSQLHAVPSSISHRLNATGRYHTAASYSRVRQIFSPESINRRIPRRRRQTRCNSVFQSGKSIRRSRVKSFVRCHSVLVARFGEEAIFESLAVVTAESQCSGGTDLGEKTAFGSCVSCRLSTPDHSIRNYHSKNSASRLCALDTRCTLGPARRKPLEWYPQGSTFEQSLRDPVFVHACGCYYQPLSDPVSPTYSSTAVVRLPHVLFVGCLNLYN